MDFNAITGGSKLVGPEIAATQEMIDALIEAYPEFSNISRPIPRRRRVKADSTETLDQRTTNIVIKLAGLVLTNRLEVSHETHVTAISMINQHHKWQRQRT